MRIELLPPRRARIRKQDVHMVRRPAHFFDQVLDALELGAVGRHGDCSRAWLQVWERIECFAGGVAGGGFAAGDVDFGCAGLEESRGFC
jgi:hypothetical protein